MYILLIILIIIAIPLILAAFLAEDYFIERDIIINRSKQTVFGSIKFLTNAGTYNKWVMMDPHLRKDFKGTDGTPGFVYYWDSDNKNVGKGEQEIKAIIQGEKIDYEIRFIKPFVNTSYAHMITEQVQPNQTKVKWGFNGKRNYPMKVFHLLFNLKKMLGRDLQTSLDNLKTVLEK